MHKTIEPTILYFSTPVALISMLNEDSFPNLAPMSLAWWLGWSAMLGLGTMSQTSENLIRTRECVINLPSQEQATHVGRPAWRSPPDAILHRRAWTTHPSESLIMCAVLLD